MSELESISKSDAIQQIAAQLDGPVSLDDLTARVLATRICLTCSNDAQGDILLCEKHLDDHEDLYAEEMVY